jgi:hypothetical protein
MGKIGGCGGKNCQKHVFQCFLVFLVIDKWLLWLIGQLYGVMTVKGTIGNIILQLDVIHWPIKQ